MERGNDVERNAAIETRFRARVSWLVPAAVMVLPVGQLEVAMRLVALVVAAGVFGWLNLRTVEVLGRARRESVPFVHWRLIAVALAIRIAAFVLVASVAW